MITTHAALRKVLQAWRLPEEAEFVQTPGGFNKNWSIFTSKHKFFLKRRPAKHRQQALTDASVCAYLFDKGLRVATPLKTKHNSHLLVKDGSVYCLFNYLAGREYADTKRDLQLAARALAEANTLGAPYRGPTAFSCTSLDWCKRHSMQYAAKQAEGQMQLRAVQQAIKETRGLRLPRGLVHWDFHKGNMKISNGEAAMFDFERAHHDARVADIANSLVCFAALDQRKIDVGDAVSFIHKCELNFDKATVFLKAYHKVAPLTAQEVRALPAMLAAAWAGWTSYTLCFLKAPKATHAAGTHFPAWVIKNKAQILEELKAAVL